MSSYLPQWMSDVGAVSSFFGLVVTIFLFMEARKIQKSFLRRARLPDITQKLSTITSNIHGILVNWPEDKASLKSWAENKNTALEQFAKIKGLLENIKPKLPNEEKKRINELLNKLQPRRYLLFKSNLSDLTKDRGLDVATDLITLVTSLEQLVKDSKWD